MDKGLSQPRPDWDNSSFEGDQIPPCNAYTFPIAKIISDGMSVTGHTVLITLSFLLQCDMIKFGVYEPFSIKSFFSYGHLLKKILLKQLHHVPITSNKLGFFFPLRFKSFIVKYLQE